MSFTSNRAIAFFAVLSFAALFAACSSQTVAPAPAPPTPPSSNGSISMPPPPDVPSFPTVTPSPEASPPPALGEGRGNPYPHGKAVTGLNPEVEVLEMVRGEEAWQKVAGKVGSEPAPEGMEYVMVKLKIKSTDEPSIKNYFGDHIEMTGDRCAVSYGSKRTTPEPAMKSEFAGGEEAEGWLSFHVRKDEKNLLLSYKPSFASRRFVALEEGNAVKVPDEVTKTKATETGKDAGRPAKRTEQVCNGRWQISLVEVIRGDEATQLVTKASSSNKPPPEGMEYVAVKFNARRVGADKPNEPEAVTEDFHFKIMTSDGSEQDPPSGIYGLNSPGMLYVGGESHGWVKFQVAAGAKGLKLVFTDPFDKASAGKRYIALDE